MGHYLSEMEGPPFTTVEVIFRLEDGVIVKGKEKHQQRAVRIIEKHGHWDETCYVVKITREYITQDRKREWYELHYKRSTDSKHPILGSCFISIEPKEWKREK